MTRKQFKKSFGVQGNLYRVPFSSSKNVPALRVCDVEAARQKMRAFKRRDEFKELLEPL